MKEHFYDMVDENRVLRLGSWRWASHSTQCGNVVADRVVKTASLQPAQTRQSTDHDAAETTFMMF